MILLRKNIQQFIALFSVGLPLALSAQVTVDFEDQTTGALSVNPQSYKAALFVRTPGIYANPDTTALNRSRYCFGAENVPDADWYSNWVELRLQTPVKVTENTVLSFLAYRSIQPKQMRIGFNGYEENQQIYLDKLPFESRWERVTIQLGTVNAGAFVGDSLRSLWIVFSCNWSEPRSGWQAASYYVDDVLLTSLPLPAARLCIDPSETYQTMVDFGASDAWTVDFVGRHWSTVQRNQIARLLFSQEFDGTGSPKGIGLSNWRVNVGAGSAEQGDESNIGDPTRRAECFLRPDSTYDWTRQQGQQYFMQKAKDFGCEHFVLFSNSAPVQYTKNNKAYARSGEISCNLQTDKFDDFAEFLATVAQHFVEQGYDIRYISPVNEPQYDWGGGQEGSPWQNNMIKKLAFYLDQSIRQRNLSTRIMLPEAGSFYDLYQGTGRASNQIDALFNPKNTTTYVGNLPSVAPLVAGHSYWSFTTNKSLKETRSTLWDAAKQYNLQVFQTEWSMLADAPLAETGFPGPGWSNASYMDLALFMGKLIHCDIVYGGASSWSYWTSLATEVYSQMNRFYLIRLNPVGGDYASLTNGGTNTDNENLWVLGNYSFFIRPGYQRIRMDGADELNYVLGSAYLSPEKDRMVTVFVNTSAQARVIETTLQDTTAFRPLTVRKYVTDKKHKLKRDQTLAEAYTGQAVTLPARSVVTLVYGLDNSPSSVLPSLGREETPSFFLTSGRLTPGGTATLEFPNGVIPSGSYTLSLHTLTGTLVWTTSVEASNPLVVTLPAHLPQGVQILSLSHGGHSYREKVVVQ